MNKIVENLLNKSGKEKITIVVLIGVLLLVVMIPTGGRQADTKDAEKSTETVNVQENTYSYETYIENKLEETLRMVEGVGDVEAVVTIKTSEENVLAKDREYSLSHLEETDSAGGTRRQETDSTKDTYIYYDIGNGSQPYVLQRNMPQIEGVVIVAKGGGDGQVAAEVTSAVEALLNIPAHKIKVLKMS